MSAKAIREATGKDILNRLLDSNSGAATSRFASVSSETNWTDLVAANPWLETSVSSLLLLLVKCAVKAICLFYDVKVNNTCVTSDHQHKSQFNILLTFTNSAMLNFPFLKRHRTL